MKKKHKFLKGLLIYCMVMLGITMCLWFVAWNYAAAYEMAQPVGAMNAYMAENMEQQLADAVAEYSAAHANEYQSAEDVAAVVNGLVMDGEYSYRKNKEYKTNAPVYTIYNGDLALGKTRLEQGIAYTLDFGQEPWEVQPLELELEGLVRGATVIAPADCAVTVNGYAVQPTDEVLTGYPGFEEYATTIKEEVDLRVYRVEGLIAEGVVVESGSLTVMAAEEADTWYVLPELSEELQVEFEELAPKFIDAYLMFTSNAGSFEAVQPYLAPEGELVDRLRRSLDGLSWVKYTTGKVLETEVKNITYYGNVATYEASYVLQLKSGDMEGNMYVVMVRGENGWRVSDIELF